MERIPRKSGWRRYLGGTESHQLSYMVWWTRTSIYAGLFKGKEREDGGVAEVEGVQGFTHLFQN